MAMAKLDVVSWMRSMQNAPSAPVRARVWRVTSCDAMYVLQLTYAPWCIEGDNDVIECSHLAVVNAVDAAGAAHIFYVHEHACRVQGVYGFNPTGRQMWMEQNEEAPMGLEATIQ